MARHACIFRRDLAKGRALAALATALCIGPCSRERLPNAGTPVPSVSAAAPALGEAEVETLQRATPGALGDDSDAAVPTTSPAGPPDGMALVPAGAFTMGADTGGEPDEHPAHRVEVPAFHLDLTEVTNEAYGECIAAGVCRAPDPTSAARNGFGSDAPFRRPQQPVSAVSWDDARTYCHWRGKRLPTEAEWEKAARGTDARQFPWGTEEPTAERAVFGGAPMADVGTHVKGDGPFGHHDSAGNVWEWVRTCTTPRLHAAHRWAWAWWKLRTSAGGVR